MMQRADARDFLFGRVHEGFYTSLFPQAENSSSRANITSPYLTIIRAIRAKAADILKAQGNNGQKINVWITRYSLVPWLYYTLQVNVKFPVIFA